METLRIALRSPPDLADANFVGSLESCYLSVAKQSLFCFLSHFSEDNKVPDIPYVGVMV